MTAEFAAVLPAVVVVLAMALGCIQLAGQQLALQSATTDAARMLARGDAAAAARVGAVVAGAHVTESRRDGLVCASSDAPASIAGVIRLSISSTACALDEVVTRSAAGASP